MKQFAKATLVRAVKTFAQAFVAFVPTTALVMSDVNWLAAASAAGLAAVLSVATSIVGGLPEVDKPT